MTNKILTYDQRQALGEYILCQQRAGRKEIPADELKIAIDAILIALPEGSRHEQEGT